MNNTAIYTIWFGNKSKTTFGDLLNLISKGDMFYVPRYCKITQRWELLTHKSNCEKIETVLKDKGVYYVKDMC